MSGLGHVWLPEMVMNVQVDSVAATTSGESPEKAGAPKRRRRGLRAWLGWPLKLGLTCLGLGLLTTLAVAWILAATVDVMTGTTMSADSYDASGHWSVSRWEKGGAMMIRSVRVRGLNWGPEQVTGAPDTPTMGDQVTAWASASSDSGTEWIELYYAKAVIPRQVHVYENDAPGALVKVEVCDKHGNWHLAWEGVDPSKPPPTPPTPPAAPVPPVPPALTPGAPEPASEAPKGAADVDARSERSTGARPPAVGGGTSAASARSVYTLTEDEPVSGTRVVPGGTGVAGGSVAAGAPAPQSRTTGGVPVSKINISLNVPTKKIRIWLACDTVPGWNEVDAVGLIDDQNLLQWARGATASSTYASRSGGGGAAGPAPIALVPAWSNLHAPRPDYFEHPTMREERLIDARGWPMLAMMSERDGTQAGTLPAAQSSQAVVSSFTMTPPPGTTATTPGGNPRAPFPVQPIWSGLVGNTIFFGVIYLFGWVTLIVPRRFVREVARVRSGCCVECGYDLGYDFVKGCPECGWRRERAEQAGRPD